MRFVLRLLLVCFLMFVSLPTGAKAESAEANARVATNAINAFAFDVYAVLAAESGNENIFFSPYSISSALAMTYAGASGETAEEMAKTLRFTGFEDEIHAAMKSLQDRFNAIPSETGILDVANRLWLDKEDELTPGYEALMREYYGAGVETVDFYNSYNQARVEINDWVAQKTRDKIKDILQEGSVSSDTTLILVNAIYFNSAWLEPFDKALTWKEPFRTGKDDQYDVSMMRRTDYFLYGDNSDAQWVKIPYKIPGFSMLLILPRENEQFTQMKELEKKLTHDALISWVSNMRRSRVSLHMPKFKDERRYSLGETFKKLGMNLAFTEDADFSGMVVDPLKDDFAIHMNLVVHKAFIELDEERTEAAAATAASLIRFRTNPDEPPAIEFKADRPFIYCLMDDETGTILFMGRMERP